MVKLLDQSDFHGLSKKKLVPLSQTTRSKTKTNPDLYTFSCALTKKNYSGSLLAKIFKG